MERDGCPGRWCLSSHITLKCDGALLSWGWPSPGKQGINSLFCFASVHCSSFPYKTAFIPTQGFSRFYPCLILCWPTGWHCNIPQTPPGLSGMLPDSNSQDFSKSQTFSPLQFKFPLNFQAFQNSVEFHRPSHAGACLCPERSPLFLWAFCWNKYQWSSPWEKGPLEATYQPSRKTTGFCCWEMVFSKPWD